jgi:drug/metabolite transporter (DMT)-like permease
MQIMQPTKSRLRHTVIPELALLLLLAVLWGGSYPLTKLALKTIPPFTLVALRVSIAAVLLLVIVWWKQLSIPREARVWGAFFVQACFNSIVSWSLVAYGQQFVPSALAGILNSTSPIFVFLITCMLTRHEAATAQKLLGTIAGLGGVCLILGVEVLRHLGQQVVAQLALVAGALCYAGAAIYGRRFGALPAIMTAAGTMTWAATCLIPVSLVVDQPWKITPSLGSLLAAVALGSFSTAGALMLYFRLVRTLGSMGVASQSYLRAGVSVLLGVMLLGESFTWSLGVGLAAVVVGVAAINGQLSLAWGFWLRKDESSSRLLKKPFGGLFRPEHRKVPQD